MSGQGRLLGVDGIRAIAAFTILVWHVYIYGSPDGAPDFGAISNYVAPQLQLGVWVFFCLSAFLLYRPFAAAVLERRSFPDLRRYMRGRALRIVPVYWVILTLVTFVFGAATYRVNGGGFGIDVGSWLAGMFFVHSYHPSTVVTGIGPTWSLSVEVVFYAVLPALGILALAAGRRARSHRGRIAATLLPAAALLGLGVICRELGQQLFYDPADPAGFRGTWFAVWQRSFLAQSDLFAFGMVLAVLKLELDHGRLRLPAGWRSACVTAGVAISVPLIVMERDGQLASHRFATYIGLTTALFVAAVVLVDRAVAPRDRLVSLLEWRPIRWSGEISYSVFLWHYPVVVFMRKHELGFSGQAGFFANVVIVATVTWALSSITFRLIERPMMLRKVPSSRQPAAAATAAQASAAP